LKVGLEELGKPNKPHTQNHVEWYPDREEGGRLSGQSMLEKAKAIL